MHSAYVGRQTLRYKEHHNTRATSFDKIKQSALARGSRCSVRGTRGGALINVPPIQATIPFIPRPAQCPLFSSPASYN